MIGIDSGGTSTKAAAFDQDGNILIETKSGFGNLLMGVDEGLTHIRQAIEEIFSVLSEKGCQLIVLGVAGVEAGDFRQVFLQDLKRYSPKVVVLNDAWMAHYALLKGHDGCLIISGTGSIMMGRYNGLVERVGGWGNLFGDGGSGFDIAKRLVQKVLHAYDIGLALSPLETRLMERGDFTNPFELIKFVYSSGKDQVAELALVAFEEAEKGDREAITLLEKAGTDLAIQTEYLIHKLGIEGEKKIAVTGSILLKSDRVFQAFEQRLRVRLKQCKFIREDKPNAIGAYYYYKLHHSGYNRGNKNTDK